MAEAPRKAGRERSGRSRVLSERMENNQNRRTRVRRRGAGAALAVLLLGVLAFCTPVLAASEPEEAAGGASLAPDPVAVTIEYGYDNTAKGGRYLPLSVQIENRQESVLDCVLGIRARESDGTVYQYNYDLSLEPGEPRQEKYYIPIGAGTDRLFLTLEDGQGQLLAQRQVDLNISRDVPELFIGLLSDDPESLDYFHNVGISYSTLRTHTFVLRPEEFPGDEVGLNLLDVLVVNNFTLRNLSEQQTSAIMDWVHSGGVLLLGTGQRVDDTLGRFAPELLDESYGTPELRNMNLGEDFPLDSPVEGLLDLTYVDIPLHGGNVILSSNGFPLLTAAAKEQGLIGMAGFDLAEIRDFCRNRPPYVDHLFTSLLGETRINQLAEVVYSGNSGKFWSVQSLINTGNVEKLPNLPLYVTIVVIYLLILGPGLYLFLRNRQLQIYYRRGVVMLSLVFAVVIYLLGTTTRFRGTFYTYATIQDVTEDYVTDTTYVNIRNPYNRPYQVQLDPSYSVLPITRSYQNETEGQGTFSSEEPWQVAIERGEDRLTVEGQNIASFTPLYFELQRKTDNEEGIGIVGDVDYFEGKLSGSITNCFPFPLENVTLLLYGNMVLVDGLEPGETRQLDDLTQLRFPLNHSYMVAERIIGEDLLENTNIADTTYLLALERANILTFYLENYMNGYMADARVIAFSAQKEEGLFLREPDPETYGHMMLTSSVSVNASRDRTLYRSVLMRVPRVISGSYDVRSNAMRGTEPLTLEYQMGTDIDVESLTFEPVSEDFLSQDGNQYIQAFTGGIYFYNYSSGNYDRIELTGETLDVEALRPYLSPGNTLNVRYVYDGSHSYNAIQLPMPMVAGREH